MRACVASAARLSGTSLDVSLAAVVGAAVAGAEVLTASVTDEPQQASGMAMLLVAAASLTVLSRWPLVTAVVVGVTTPAYYMLGSVDSAFGWAVFAVGVFRLAAERHRGSAITGVIVAFGFFVAGEAVQFQLGRSLMALAWLTLILAAGEIARVRRAYLHEYEQRAVEAERSRDELARRRATEERLRIARELHDVIAHNISLINVQAGAATHRRDPEQAYTALESIKHTSKDTLRELRSTLGVLRWGDTDDTATAVPVAPAPSLQRLDELASQVHESGLPVTVEVEGAPVDVPAPVDLAGYRIAQEALTNALRHSGAARATVRLRYTRDHLTVEVDDDGHGAPATAVMAGSGVRGMRERATLVGGDLEARSTDRGFRVRARLPVIDGDGDGVTTTAG